MTPVMLGAKVDQNPTGRYSSYLETCSHPANELIVLSHATSAQSDDRFLRLAAWMGVTTKKVVAEDGAPVLSVLEQTAGEDSCVAVSAESLAAIAGAIDPRVLRQFVTSQIGKLLVYTCGDSPANKEALAWVPEIQVCDTHSGSGELDFHLPKSGYKLSKQFAGLEFSSDPHGPLAVFGAQAATGQVEQVILRTSKGPVFVRVSCGSCEVFLLALSDVPEIQTPLSQDKRIEEFYGCLIPILIWLRYCFGENCWRAPATTARLIIDDPLLTDSYGFLDYGTLLRSMRALEYGTTVAFIPWNYWRTSRKQAARFRTEDPYFSICVHGCDHTNKEFGPVDPERLDWKASTALRRMEKQAKGAGMPYEKVMVFPQGWFSSPAIQALRHSQYLAAINTTCFPINDHAEQLTIADFLRPAVTRFYGQAVFQRRYPKRMIDFAFDVFLGRPAFFVEHHQYFRDGYDKLEDFVRNLHEIEPSLTWPTLSSQLRRCCLVKAVSGTTSRVQFYTRQFEFHNPRSSRTTIALEKHEPNTSIVSKVLVDGASVDFSFREDSLVFEAEADAGQTVTVEVVDKPRPVKVSPKPTLKYRAGVPVRRALSEFRDNTLAKHPKLLEAATALARTMKATADHDREEPR
jgi:hypothetical protein